MAADYEDRLNEQSRVRPTQVGTERASDPAQVAGVSGTVVYNGYVQDNENDRALQGSNRYRTFLNTLLNVSIVAAGTRYFLNLVSRPRWKLVPPPDVEGAEEYAKLAMSTMYGAQAQDTPWHRVVRRAATFRFWGFSVQEWTARRRADGVVGMGDISARPQATISRWDQDRHGRVYGIVQTDPSSGRDIYLPRWKMIYLVDDSISDSPEGVGLFRHIAEPVRRLKRYEQLEGWGYETDLRGIPVGRAPMGLLAQLVKDETITQQDADRAMQGLDAFLQGHVRTPTLGLKLDSKTYTDPETQQPSTQRMWDLDLLKAEATSQPEVLRSIDRVNREIARVLGVEQLLLGDNGSGSFAMAREKNHNFAIVVDTTLEELRETFQRDWLGTLWSLNGWPIEAMPTIQTDKLQFRNIDDVTSALERIARAGAPLMPDDPAILDLRELLGLSLPATIPSAEDLGLLPGKTDARAQPPPADGQ